MSRATPFLLVPLSARNANSGSLCLLISAAEWTVFTDLFARDCVARTILAEHCIRRFAVCCHGCKALIVLWSCSC
jgi:hypothetical protein